MVLGPEEAEAEEKFVDVETIDEQRADEGHRAVAADLRRRARAREPFSMTSSRQPSVSSGR